MSGDTTSGAAGRPARFGLPYTGPEIRRICEDYAAGVPAAEMVRRHDRPTDGIIYVAEKHGAFRKPRLGARHSARWTSDELAEMRRLVARGMSDDAIAKALARTFDGVRRKRWRLGIPATSFSRRRKQQTFTPAMTHAHAALVAEMGSVGAAAVVLGITGNALWQRLRRGRERGWIA